MFLVSTCPYCQTQKIPFDIQGHALAEDQSIGNTLSFYVLGICGHCQKPTIFLIYKNFLTTYNIGNAELTDCIEILTKPKDKNILKHFTLYKKIIPPPQNILYQCPKHVPENIKNTFEEAAQCYSYDLSRASLSMLRTCLDLTTKQLLPEYNDKEKSLFKRIEILSNQGLIRPRLKQIASEIRIDGNNATHDGYANQESLKAIFRFTIFLLRELFTDPIEMETNEERRNQRQEQGTKE